MLRDYVKLWEHIFFSTEYREDFVGWTIKSTIQSIEIKYFEFRSSVHTWPSDLPKFEVVIGFSALSKYS